jgi:glycosyltransferase involved in cell wall biosynthesis
LTQLRIIPVLLATRTGEAAALDVKIAIGLEYPLMQQGGTEVLVRELLRGLSPHFQIVLVSGDASASDLPKEFSSLISAHFPWVEGNRTAESANRLAQSLKKEGIELAHFHFGGTYEWQSKRFWRCPIIYLSRLGVPCYSTNHLAVEWLNSGCNPARSHWQKLILQGCAWVSRAIVYSRLKNEVAVSVHDQRRLQKMFPIFKNKISQRYHSLLQEEGSEPNLCERDSVVLCVGTLGGRKAQGDLVSAFGMIARRHPEWRLDLIGREGEAKDVEQIKARIKEDGTSSQVQLSGRLSDEETLRRMRSASIIAMPSVQEGLGLSLQEALFHGCVGVGTRAGGIPELIDDGVNGILVPPGDMAALSAAVDKLISKKTLLQQLRKEARASILRKGMTAKAMVEQYLEDYHQLMRARE